MTRALIAASLLTIMLCLILGWSMLTASAQIIGEPYPLWCIYWDGAQAYEAPCQDFAVYSPLALTGWDVFGPPPTPGPERIE